jgi:hypothetical protein
VEVKMEDDLILVGFGEYTLTEMLSWIDDPLKEQDLLQAFVKYKPPRYKPARICSEREIMSCGVYARWLACQVNEYEKATKKKITELEDSN